MEKILVVEDNDEINRLLCEMLTQANYQVCSAFSGTEGLMRFEQEEFSLILLDLMLPGKSGEEVLTKIRKKSKVPVIVISAKSEMGGKVDLLMNGADDYIVKPFDVREVLARVKLQLKKNMGIKKENTSIQCGELVINTDMKTVEINGNMVSLTRLEYNIVQLLYANPNKVFTKQELFEQAWDEYYVGEDKTINVHVSNIRNKFKQYTENNYIETVWGIGFRAVNEK